MESLLKEEQSTKKQMKKEMEDLSLEFGGLYRYNLTSAAYHYKNPEACRQCFGYESFDVMNTMLECWFPKLNQQEVPRYPGHNPSISEYEKCIITIMKFHRNLPSIFLGLLLNRVRCDTMINE